MAYALQIIMSMRLLRDNLRIAPGVFVRAARLAL